MIPSQLKFPRGLLCFAFWIYLSIPSFVFAGTVGDDKGKFDNSTAKSGQMAMVEFLNFHRDNVWCCINSFHGLTQKPPNKFMPLIQDVRKYIYEKNKGIITIGETFNIAPYYDQDIPLIELFKQIVDAGFEESGAMMSKECAIFLDEVNTTLCANVALCNDCLITLHFSFHDKDGSPHWFSLGYPIYEINVQFRGNMLVSIIARFKARK